MTLEFNFTLGACPLPEVPPELLHLRVAADCIYNLLFYEDKRFKVQGLEKALGVISWAQYDLEIAEKHVQEALEALRNA